MELIEREDTMQIGNKELVVIGDRVLVKREDLEERTKVGLYLPQTVVEKEEVQSGRIMATGPGSAAARNAPKMMNPWRNSPKEPRYLPLQVEEGDFALFLQKAAMEISFEGGEISHCAPGLYSRCHSRVRYDGR